jgi:thiosulfate dehydrogenase
MRFVSAVALLAVLPGPIAGCAREPASPPAAAGSGPVVPHDSLLPDGPLGVSIRRGRAILANTKDSLPEHVGNGLRCFSCHLENGTKPGFLTLVGVYSRFPQYRSRNARVNLIEDRVNDCFERSMNGKVLPQGATAMSDIVAYFAWLSRGVPPPGDIPGVGLPAMAQATPDTVRGRQVFETTCTRCHGEGGLGTPIAPPLWGPGSFSIGAGMARLRTAAAFIRENMPNDRAVVLDDQQAFDVAAYVVSRPRADFAGKMDDWPYGDPPPDVAYPTKAGRRQ